MLRGSLSSRFGEAVQSPGEAGDAQMFADDLCGIARIESERILVRKCRTSIAPVLAAQIAALERVDLLVDDAEVEPQQKHHHVGSAYAGGARSTNYGFHVFRRIETRPGIAVELLPLRLGHGGVVRGDVLKIVAIEVGVEVRSAAMQCLMIGGPRQCGRASAAQAGQWPVRVAERGYRAAQSRAFRRGSR